MHQVMDLTCPGCGAPADTTARECLHCGRPVVITTFNSIRDWSAPEVSKYMNAYTSVVEQTNDPDVRLALAICLVKLGLPEMARPHVDQAIAANVDNAEAYLYAAITRLGGKRPFLAPLPQVKEALQLLDAARMLEPRGVFDYASGAIRRDFFERKFLRITPSSTEEFARAQANGVSHTDIDFAHELLRIPAGS